MFDLSDLNPPARFYYGKEQKEWVDLRLAADEDLRAIRDGLGIKTRTEYKVNPETRRMDRIEYQDIGEDVALALNRAVNQFCIVGWHLEDNKGNEIPFTPDNVNLMMERSARFSGWVAKRLKKLRDDLEAETEAEIKNS